MKYHKINKQYIDTALDKAHQYRSLLEPDLAISICLDIFAVDKNNQAALVIYILALTDEYSHNCKPQSQKIIEAIDRLTLEFHRLYYTGIFLERKARALLKQPMSRSFAYSGLMKALEKYQLAEKLAPEHCSDPILRYNSCLRTIEKENLQPRNEFNELF